MHTSNLYHNVEAPKLHGLLVESTRNSGGMPDAAAAFICNSGTEANEAALKFARKVGKTRDPSGAKHEIVCFTGGFHGRSFGALSASTNPKYQDPFAPLVPGFRVAQFNSIEGLDAITENTCGVIVEPIQGESGVHVASAEFLEAVGKRCREVGAVLIHDEIQCGMGRTGTLWAHAGLSAEAMPNIITSAKALGNGFPIGATIVDDSVHAAIEGGDHGTTFGGNPLACAVGYAVLTQVQKIIDSKATKGRGRMLHDLGENIQKLMPELVTEVRGRGMMMGLQLSTDPKPVVDKARENGLLVLTAGGNTIRLLPAYTTSTNSLHRGMLILARSMREAYPELAPTEVPEQLTAWTLRQKAHRERNAARRSPEASEELDSGADSG